MSYDEYAETFARSRRSMKWAEIGYFIAFLGKERISRGRVLDL